MPVKIEDPDPLFMSGLDPLEIKQSIDAKKEPKKKAPTPAQEIELAKEARLSAKESRLATGPSKPAAPEPPPPTPEMDKTKMLDRLMAYKERFPALKSRNKTLKTAEEIADELHYVELQLGSATDHSYAGKLFVLAMGGIEQLNNMYNPLNLNLHGLSGAAQQNLPELQPLLDELAIKYGGTMYMPVEYRLCLAVGSLVYTVHVCNTDPRAAQAIHKAHVASKEHADL